MTDRIKSIGFYPYLHSGNKKFGVGVDIQVQLMVREKTYPSLSGM